MAQNIETGKIGEDVACDFLRKNGFRVLLRNVRNKFGEIDIVAKDQDKAIVFIEVKTIRQFGKNDEIAEFMPEDQMSSSKMRKFKRIAEFFANENQHLLESDAGWRLDFVGVIFDDSGAPTIRHYKNIF